MSLWGLEDVACAASSSRELCERWMSFRNGCPRSKLGPTVPVPEAHQPCQSPARVFLRRWQWCHCTQGDAKGRVAGAALPQRSALKCKAVIRSILRMFSPDVFPFDMNPALLARAQECIVA